MENFAARADQVLGSFAGKKTLVIGDIMLDEFVWGRVTRISPEAPVPVVDVVDEERFAGGAANVARNLRALDGEVKLIGRVGCDKQAGVLLDVLREGGVDVSLVLEAPDVPTTVKTRIIASDIRAHVGQEFAGLTQGHRVVERPHQIVRVDREKRSRISQANFDSLVKILPEVVGWADAVIVQDYGKGVVTQEVADLVGGACRAANTTWLVDPNPGNPLSWCGPTVVKPNRAEAFAAAGLAISEDKAQLEKVGAILMEKWGCGMLLITLGSHGMCLFRKGVAPYYSPTKAIEVFDVSGAGDTTISAFTLALSAGATPVEATEIANHAAGIAVGKIGTATVSREEITRALRDE